MRGSAPSQPPVAEVEPGAAGASQGPAVSQGSTPSSSGSPDGVWTRFRALLARPVDGASLAAFRIAVGLIMVLEAITLTRPSASTGGAVPLQTYYTDPRITFSFQYSGFHWLPLLPSTWMWVLVWALGIAGLTMALGLFHRVSAGVVFLVWGYLYAVESTRTYWMSHYYLVLLVTFLMIWLPAARRYSMDALRSGEGSTRIPFWPIFLLRGQLVITYFYAGVAKLNADWLLDAEPVRYYLSQPHVTTPFASVNAMLKSAGFAYFISYSGALFDLSVGFLLLFRRTRIAGLVLMCVFHATNHFLLFQDIGWFPLLGITTATIFLAPDWPERLRAWFGYRRDAGSAWSGAREFRMASIVPVFVVLWLGWQSVFPLRRYLIPGDARVTFEGLSFSWRLKAEVYRTTPSIIRVRDPGLFPASDPSTNTIDWTQWKGDRVIYRQSVPGKTDWAQLPEIVVFYEPILGERICYNPFANGGVVRDNAAAKNRLNELWAGLYGRHPSSVEDTVPLPRIVDAFRRAWVHRGGSAAMGPQELLQVMVARAGPKSDGQMLSMLRRTQPFELAGTPPVPGPFLVIEDAGVIQRGADGLPRVVRGAWKNGPATRPPGGSRYAYVGGEPIILHTVELSFQTMPVFPDSSIVDSQAHPEQPPFIPWNYMEDVTVSKAMHIGMQPFLLRRYARRVADLWEARFGRRPAVYASTGVSLNGRPYQPIVDPKADLATVSVRWFGHNRWIMDLQEPRIPRDRVLPGFLGTRMGGDSPTP